MDFLFCKYEDWMKDQVVEMFCQQYGNTREQFSDYFEKFYSSYQKDRAIRIVILQGETVAGFVSFSYWPYLAGNKTYNSYQCGNVIIHRSFRGQGLYNRLLDHLNKNAHHYNIDFIVGFPIKEILKLYLKSGWTNNFNMKWLLKIINPFGVLFKMSDDKIQRQLNRNKKYINTFAVPGQIILEIEENFYRWNERYNNSNHYYFCFESGSNWVEFSLKFNRRQYLNELIIGEVNTNSTDITFLYNALKELRKKAFSLRFVSILSICINEKSRHDNIFNAIIRNGFKKINKEIKFITKNFTAPRELLNDSGAWTLYRRDVDTW